MSEKVVFKDGSEKALKLCEFIADAIGRFWTESTEIAGPNAEVAMKVEEKRQFENGEIAVRFTMEFDAYGVAFARYEMTRGDEVLRTPLFVSPRNSGDLH